MHVRVGTSGFAYKEWKGSFYPEDLAASKMLGFYSERFDTVEINNTYYRMPKVSVLENWASQVPDHFAFVLKAPQRVTHWKRIEEIGEACAYFFAASAVLGKKLGPILVQLPPYLKRDLDALRSFLALVPSGVRIALEVSSGWLDDEIYNALRQANAALCIVDDPKKRTPLVPTASWGYLRLRETTYGPSDLERWVAQVQAQSWQEAWVFFKHEDAGTGPKLGAQFRSMLA